MNQFPILIIVGNYPLDHQQSMERFADMLLDDAKKHGVDATIWKPTVFFARLVKDTTSGYAKWLGYLDKWILYPLLIRIKTRRLMGIAMRPTVRFLIADHSNAIYLQHLPADLTAITCHDVLAIRGARGDLGTHCPASRMGTILQNWILRNLVRSPRLAAVSQTTLSQIMDLDKSVSAARPHTNRDWRVIRNGFNANFSPMASDRAKRILLELGINPQSRFILHVGSDLPRKNRAMLLSMSSLVQDKWDGQIVIAGAAGEHKLRQLAVELGLSERLIEVVSPSHETLVALYSTCFAFVFPSYSEGFGWPLIEAQACGAPVIASNIEPMPEISGGSSLHANPDDPQAFASHLMSLQDESFRTQVIEAGYKNVKRFQGDQMIRDYIDLLGLRS